MFQLSIHIIFIILLLRRYRTWFYEWSEYQLTFICAGFFTIFLFSTCMTSFWSFTANWAHPILQLSAYLSFFLLLIQWYIIYFFRLRTEESYNMWPWSYLAWTTRYLWNFHFTSNLGKKLWPHTQQAWFDFFKLSPFSGLALLCYSAISIKTLFWSCFILGGMGVLQSHTVFGHILSFFFYFKYSSLPLTLSTLCGIPICVILLFNHLLYLKSMTFQQLAHPGLCYKYCFRVESLDEWLMFDIIGRTKSFLFSHLYDYFWLYDWPPTWNSWKQPLPDFQNKFSFFLTLIPTRFLFKLCVKYAPKRFRKKFRVTDFWAEQYYLNKCMCLLSHF